MAVNLDSEGKRILKIIETSDEPLETTEIIEKLPKVSRSKVMYRLFQLQANGQIRAKQIGSGKGTWIWWKK